MDFLGVYKLAFDTSIQKHNYEVIKFYLTKRTYCYAFKEFVTTEYLSVYLLAALNN